MAVNCYLCGFPVYSDGKGDCAPEKDHIVPVSQAPRLEDYLGNVRWVHKWCNRVKSDRSAAIAQADIRRYFLQGQAPSCLR
jgi:hypothetical protein